MVTNVLAWDSKKIQPNAQRIFDNIWLGPIDVARSKEYLAKLNISAVVSVLGSDNQSMFDSVAHENKLWVKVAD